MPVGEMLSRMSSFELTEWEAYERAYGPLGRAYEADALATLVEAWLTSEDHRHHHPRPHEVFELAEKRAEAEASSPEVIMQEQLSAFDKELGFE